MFLFRWIKNLIVLALLAAALYWASGHFSYQGRTYRDWVTLVYNSPVWQEGSKDFRVWAGQVLQGAGKKLQEGVTPAEQKKLENLIQGDLVKQGQPLPPAVKSSPIPAKK